MATDTLRAESAPANHQDRSEWDRRLLTYRAAKALADADYKFGRYFEINNVYDLEVAILKERYGSMEAAKKSQEGQARFERAWKNLTTVEEARTEKYLVPMWEAARRLAETPSPDFEALLLKIELIDSEELWNDSGVPYDCFDMVQQELRQFAPQS